MQDQYLTEDALHGNQSESTPIDDNSLDLLFDKFTDDAWLSPSEVCTDNTLWLDLQTAIHDGQQSSLTEPAPSDAIATQITTEYSVLEQSNEPAVVSPLPRTESPWSGFQSPAGSSDQPRTPVKTGNRFSKESIKILRRWLSNHKSYPYPNEKEKTFLQQQTGLNKVQVANWLANARRRNKAFPASSQPSASPSNRSTPIDIPRRPPTPAIGDRTDLLNPLQRWVDSPPESEPASASAIALAIASSSGCISDNMTDFEAIGPPTYQGSSAGSLSTSRSSGGSLASAHSFDSQKSLYSSAPFSRGHRLRGRRARMERNNRKTTLDSLPKTFQCTFCTETFRTKYDWQRHEKALHITLEKWVCSPDGPSVLDPLTNEKSCVFCGASNPDQGHIESHNFNSCRERTITERTFYRKDHLSQHLRLVHGTKFFDRPMNGWKVSITEIKSRCGFCEATMDTWDDRIDHLARHFKNGCAMVDWKGGWGFEPHVTERVENFIPPYLIEQERNTPFPYEASRPPLEGPRSAYELIKLELLYSIQNHFDETGTIADNQITQLEACRIIFAAETMSDSPSTTGSSWLRDLIMSDEHISKRAQLGPVRSHRESRLSSFKIHSKENFFSDCPLEFQLQKFFQQRESLGVAISDFELQKEAYEIIGRMEAASVMPCDLVANWLVKLVGSSTNWINNFRQRMQSASAQKDIQPDALEQASIPCPEVVSPEPSNLAVGASHFSSSKVYKVGLTLNDKEREGANYAALVQPGLMLGNDGNLHKWFNRDLRRWVASTMSPNNPNCHIPSDEEIQYQSRWILYDDDDPWNFSPADNTEWLRLFKIEAGILPKDHTSS